MVGVDQSQAQSRSSPDRSHRAGGRRAPATGVAVSHFILSLKTNTYLDFTREDLRHREDRVNFSTVAAALPVSLRMPVAAARAPGEAAEAQTGGATGRGGAGLCQARRSVTPAWPHPPATCGAKSTSCS